MDFQQAISKAQHAITVTNASTASPSSAMGSWSSPPRTSEVAAVVAAARTRPEAAPAAVVASASAPAQWGPT
jgi:hypothetical protein